ncbi:sulfate adenylyltransferase [bacterium]|nr:sulfate adenylyltransferase [bacterium]
MNEKDYRSCLENMTLTNGSVWTIPIVLGTEKAVKVDDVVILKDETGVPIASMVIDDVYTPDLLEECRYVLGSDDSNHPYHSIIMSNKGKQYIGGKVTKIRLPADQRLRSSLSVNLPLHYDFMDLRYTPEQTKEYFKQKGWNTIIGFQTRNPLHRSHYELTKFALKEVGDDAKLLLHPSVGVTQDCDIDYHTRVRCYKKLVGKYPEDTVHLSLLPLSMRMAGPREAVWHALIRKNYGCTHFIVGRDHAGPSYKKKDGSPFYGPYEAHELLTRLESKIGIKIVMSPSIVYVKELGEYRKENEVSKDMTVLNISGTQQRDMLSKEVEIPEWFSWKDIIEELRNEFKVINNKGLCIYLVGLSGSGKSTTANVLIDKLKEMGVSKKITLLDADVVRLNLSKGLGFSREDRSTNVRRIGYVASEIVNNGGIVVCANIAPYEEDRLFNRKQISSKGRYIEVYMKTSLECCIRRDVKGLYKLALEGKVLNFTGVSDPFEEPLTADLVLDGDDMNVEIGENVEKILKLIN